MDEATLRRVLGSHAKEVFLQYHDSRKDDRPKEEDSAMMVECWIRH